MPDLLVKLYSLPPAQPSLDKLAKQGVDIRPAIPPEKDVLKRWVAANFPDDCWPAEVEVCFARQPVSCLVATQSNQFVGFACYDATCKAFFGPTGVAEKSRGRGIGTALL